MKSDEIINAQLAELLGRYGESEEKRKDIDLVRQIAALYEKKGDLQSALEWFNYTSALTNHFDPAVAHKAAEIELRLFDKSIAEFESWLALYGDAENAQEVRRQLEDLKVRRLVISQSKAMSWATTGMDQAHKPKGRHGPW